MKYKNELAAIIAILTVSTLALTLTPSATAGYTGEATVVEGTTRVRDDAMVLVTITVNNTNVGAENVDNILIRDTSATTSAGTFLNPYGGNENVYENWDNIADNLLVVADNMVFVRDNLLLVVTFFKNAAANFQTFADAERLAGEDLKDSIAANDNNNVSLAGNDLLFAADDWEKAAIALAIEPFDLRAVTDNLRLAADHERDAGVRMVAAATHPILGNTLDSALDNAGENLKFIGDNLDNSFCDKLDNTIIVRAAFDLFTIAENWIYVANWLDNLTTDAYALYAADHIENGMAIALKNAAENMNRAALALDNAGEMLGRIDNAHLIGAETIVARYSRGCASTVLRVTDNLLDHDAMENFENAINELDIRADEGSGLDNWDNLMAFGENMKNAAATMTTRTWLGPLLGSDLIGYAGESSTTSARYHLNKAADNLRDSTNLDITTAAGHLYSFAQQLEAAGTKIKATMALLSPTTGWGFEVNDLSGSTGFMVTPIQQDNKLAAATSMTISFLWQAPNIATTEEAHAITVWTYGKVGSQDNRPSTPKNFTITIDGREPYATSTVVQQDGVSVPSVVGRNYNDGQFTFTVNVSEELSAIGDLYVENWGNGSPENVMPPVTLDTYDDMEYFYTFDTTLWEDNWENLRFRIDAPWATDTYGLENSENLIENFIFDTRDPVFSNLGAAGENGLAALGGLIEAVKPGTTTSYRRTHDKTWIITVKAEDNWPYADESWVSVTLLANDVEVDTERTPDENTWDGELTLNEGVNTVTVKVTDRVGNSIENTLTNVYCDNTMPTVSFISVAGQTWSDNNLVVNENGINGGLRIVLGIQDSGWGIVRENIWVYLDNDENTHNGENFLLENLGIWDNGAIGTFENYYDNVVSGISRGLDSGVWWVVVNLYDNVRTQGAIVDNDNYSQKFTIDVDAPPRWTLDPLTNPLNATAVGNPKIQRTNTVTLTGIGAEVGATVTLYLNDVAQALTATVNADGGWTITGTLTEGTETKIEVTLSDAAGSESVKVLYGYVKVDSTAPVVNIVSPATGLTTSDPSVTVNATVTDAVTEAGDIIVRVSAPGFSSPESTVHPDSSGSITITVPLAEGANEISVMCEDTAGNVSSASKITVNRTVTPWATYAAILAVVAVILAAIAVLRRR